MAFLPKNFTNKNKLKKEMTLIEKEKIVVPTNDYVFKRIFGKPGNEEITKSFLNSILDTEVTRSRLRQKSNNRERFI